MYIGQAMKNEHFLLLLSRDIESFLTQNEVELGMIHKQKKKKKDLIHQRLIDFKAGLLNESL